MSGVNRLVSELVRAANIADRLPPERGVCLLHDAIEAIRQLRQMTNIIPIQGKDALTYLRTVAASAERVPSEEWRHALLHAAGMIRDLSIVIDSGTVIHVVSEITHPTTSLDIVHD